MSIFRKILDKLGLRKEQPPVVGTTKVVHPDPPTAASDVESTPAAKPAGPAPTSDIDFKDKKRRLGKEAKD